MPDQQDKGDHKSIEKRPMDAGDLASSEKPGPADHEGRQDGTIDTSSKASVSPSDECILNQKPVRSWVKEGQKPYKIRAGDANSDGEEDSLINNGLPPRMSKHNKDTKQSPLRKVKHDRDKNHTSSQNDKVKIEAETGEPEKNSEDKKEKKKSCWQSFLVVVSLTRPGSTPINKSVLSLCVLALFGSCFSITFLFPFLPDMVLSFGYKEEDKGYYAGLIASSMFAGRIVGSYFWGWLSDRLGRKPVIISNMALIGMSNILFGFSTNLGMAMGARFMCGVVNGVVGSSKTVMYEISDNTNQAAAMSVISFAWGGGVVLGPTISGFLAEPSKKYSDVFPKDGLFGKFPFLLASVVAGAICFLSIIPLWFLLPETLHIRKTVMEKEVKATGDEENQKPETVIFLEPEKTENNVKEKPKLSRLYSNPPETGRAYPSPVIQFPFRTDSIEFMDSAHSVEGISRVYGLGLHQSQRSLNPVMEQDQTYIKSLPDLRNRTSSFGTHRNPRPLQSNSDTGSLQHVEVRYANKGHDKSISASETQRISVDLHTDQPGTKKSMRSRICSMTFFQLLRRKEVGFSVGLYTLFSFAVIGWDEVFTVWTSTEVRFSGLGFAPDTIGATQGISSIPMLFIHVFLYPKIEAKYGAIKVFAAGCCIVIFTSIIVPSFRPLHDQQVLLIGLLVVVVGLQRLAGSSCFSSVSLFVNNSVEPHLAGSLNGMAMMFTAIARTMAPTVGGSIYAWSITSGVKIGFPFDVNLVFMMFGLTYLASNFLVAKFPQRLNKQYKSTAK